MGDAKTETPLRQLAAWLTQAQTLLALVLAVAGLVAQMLPGFQTAWMAWMALAMAFLALAWLAFSAYRAWTKPVPAAPSVDDLSVQIRGAKPFEDGDELMGRNREVGELFTTVRALEFRFGYLSGQAGAGKTSLLRAGLTRRLRREAPKWTFVYVPRAGGRPDLEILKSLKTEFQDRVADAPRLSDACRQILPTLDGPLLIACDQFEEFFLATRSAEGRATVIDEFKRVWELSREDGRLRLLFCLRKEFVDDLLSFARSLPELRIHDWRCSLSNFTLETVSEMLDQLVESGEINMSQQLRRRVAADLAHDGFVRPVELQIVLSRMLEYQVRDQPAYDQRGGAVGMLSRFIADTVNPPDKEVPEIDRQVGRHLLRALCADNFAARRPGGLGEGPLVERVWEQMRASEGGTTFTRDEVARAVARLIVEFRHARVLVDEDEDHVNLAHDYLAVAIRDATADIESAEERANRLLDQYVSQARLSKSTVLPFRVLRNIRRYASAENLSRTETKRLISRSRRRHVGIAAAAVLLTVGSATLALPFGWQAHVVQRSSHKSLNIMSGNLPLALVAEDNSRRQRLFDFDRQETIATFEVLQYQVTPDADQFLLFRSDGSIAIARAADRFSPRILLPRTGWNADARLSQIMDFSPNGGSAFALAANGDLYVWRGDGAPRRLVQLQLVSEPTTIAPPDGSSAPPRTVNQPTIPEIRFSPDGRYLLVISRTRFLPMEASREGEVRLFDLTRTYADIPPPIGPVELGEFAFAFSPDGKYLAWSDRDRREFNIGLLPHLDAPTLVTAGQSQDADLEPIWGMWFSPDSRWLLARYSNGGFDQWRVGAAPRMIRAAHFGQRPGSDILIPPSFNRDVRYVLGALPNGVHLWPLARPPGRRSEPLMPEGYTRLGETYQSALRQTYQSATFCPGSDTGILAAANGTLHRIVSPDNPRLESVGLRMLGQVALRTADSEDFIIAFSASELVFGPCSAGALEFVRFDHQIRGFAFGADRRDLLVVDAEGVSRVRWSFMLWGIPIYSSAFPPMQGEPGRP